MNSKKTKKPLRRAKRWGARIWPMAGRLAAILAAVTVMGLMFSALQAVGSMALRAVISLAILSGVLLMLYSEGLTRGVTDVDASYAADKLEKEGYATKTYGGAILGNSTKTDLSHAIRSKTNVEFKNQIADLVCQMVDDGDHLMIDDSSTALFCAKKLRDKKNLTIITNSVELVVELANVETWSILLTGGRLKAESLALVGSQCEKYLGNYHVDKVFVSCKGLDREAGVTDSNELNAQAKQAMLRAGRQKILVVDSSKIDKVSFVNITPVSGIEAVVTNARPSEAWLRYLEDQGVRCIYPKD